MLSADTFILFCKIYEAASIAGISEDELHQWKKDIQKGFYLANCYSIPNFCAKLDRKDLVDIPVHVNLQQHIMNQEFRNQMVLQNSTLLQEEVESLKNKVGRLEKKIDHLIEANSKLVGLLGGGRGDCNEQILKRMRVGGSAEDCNSDDSNGNDCAGLMDYPTAVKHFDNERRCFERKIYIFLSLEIDES